MELTEEQDAIRRRAKQGITNGSYAETLIAFAREDEGVSGFVVRRSAQGFSVTREEAKMGLNSSSTADLAFDATPGERLGPAGAGMPIALSTLDGGLPHTVEGTQAKLYASRVGRHWTGEAIQVLGGHGYTREFPAELLGEAAREPSTEQEAA